MSLVFQFCILLANANKNINQHCVGTIFVHQLQLYVGTDMSLAKTSRAFCENQLAVWNLQYYTVLYILSLVYRVLYTCLTSVPPITNMCKYIYIYMHFMNVWIHTHTHIQILFLLRVSVETFTTHPPATL